MRCNHPFLSLIMLFLFNMTLLAKPTLTSRPLDETSSELSIEIPLADNDALYADMISFSVDHPDITLSQWHSSIEPTHKFDTHFKQTKSLFTQSFTITMQASYGDPLPEDATLHMVAFSRTTQKSKEYLFPLSFGSPSIIQQEKQGPIHEAEDSQSTTLTSASTSDTPSSLQQKLTTLFTTTESWGVRLLLALLLGLLLSLTPCIYPMIPITVGILQSQASASLGRNFCSALTYVVGIATTFAAFGTGAALSGKLFGSFMQSPVIIIGIVILLAYFGGSMIGLYDLYLPRFMHAHQNTVSNGSLISIFFFGAASGTVASPCLSPGLVLLLSLVTASGSMLLGFALLFFFGLGLGIPLLIIGTFSSSLQILPKAGHWMVDIKQFFGFIMWGTCLYFLAGILPSYIIAWASALFSCSVGIFYCISANKAHSFTARFIKNSIGILLIALSVYLVFEAYKQTDQAQQSTSHQHFWLHDYSHALEVAKKAHKKMFIDISAPYCSICKAIDAKLFADARVQEKLNEFVVLKIEDIDADETTQMIQKKFAIVGVPTLLVYDPEADQELKRWGGELYEVSPQEFIELL